MKHGHPYGLQVTQTTLSLEATDGMDFKTAYSGAPFPSPHIYLLTGILIYSIFLPTADREEKALGYTLSFIVGAFVPDRGHAQLADRPHLWARHRKVPTAPHLQGQGSSPSPRPNELLREKCSFIFSQHGELLATPLKDESPGESCC